MRAHRARLGLTQEEVAHRAGLSERTLRNLEAGRVRRPYQDTIRRLSRDPETPSMSIRTDEGDVWSIGDGQPIVSGSRADVLAWLTRGVTTGVTGTLPTVPSLG